MGIGRLINKGLSPLGFRLSRIVPPRLQNSVLSPDRAQETELVTDMTRFRANDLRRYFLNNASQDLHKWHHYYEIYDQWFSGYRGRTDLRVLEIGVLRGGSLKMWRDYFHPEATIVGLDIDTDCKVYEDPGSRIFVAIGDQTDTSFLEKVVERFGLFDIIVDDGGHTTAQQTISFKYLYANGLKDGGVYVVEDLHSNYWPMYQDAEQSFVDYGKSLVDALHEPYLGNGTEYYFQEGKPEQLRSIKVSEFCADTQSISFYDSIIVFAKRRKSMPVSEIR